MMVKEQMKIILKGVSDFVNEKELSDKLERAQKNGRPLIVKLGLDPSAPDIHLGHAVVLRKMKQLQDLGHHVVIIIGDFTGKIGDPTGKSKGRKALSDAEVDKNAQTYCEQIFKILDREKTSVRKNSEWLSKLNFEEVLRLAATTTIARLLERDDFARRYEQQTPIGLHEFFYPLMQAYDSIAIDADIEFGGSDQTFNILMGRNLQKAFDKEQQVAIFMPILEGLDGVEKMSKSLGNYIGVNESAEVMFKKVMEVPDHLIVKYFELATDIHPDDVAQIRRRLAQGENPRDIKLELAETITALYHDPDALAKAKEYYRTAFAQKGIPGELPTVFVSSDASCVADIAEDLLNDRRIRSKSEFYRLIEQGGVRLNGEQVRHRDAKIKAGDVLKLGKKIFVRLQKE